MILYDKNGHQLDAKKEKEAVAKSNGSLSFIRTHRGRLYDPLGIDSGRLGQAEFKKVSKKVFTDYMRFLSTKNHSLLTVVQRDFINNS